MKRFRLSLPLLLVGVLAATALACGDSRRALENRQWSDSFAFRITVDPMPPRAIEDARYKVVVQDKKTGEPIETGQGRLFANSKDGARTDDGLEKGKEVGTYYGRLFFPTTGDWAIGLQFRRDSTFKLERVDWIQSVNNATGPEAREVLHFFRTQLAPAEVLRVSDEFFPTLPLERTAHTARSRTYSGLLGTLVLTVKMEGGHYTFVQIHTDQIGESRLDRNAKRFFVKLHRVADPSHRLEAAY